MNSALNGLFSERHSGARSVIGICARTAPITLQGQGIVVSLALQAHIELLGAAGCTPVLLPLLPSTVDIIGQLDGLLVPGGPDLDPSLYGGVAHPKTRGVNLAADSAELALVTRALSVGLPLLAICRGMQLLNVQAGGTLHQHLPEVIGNDRHRPETETFTLGTNRLELRSGSLIAGILDDDVPEAFCHHHQAIDRLGTGLTATAWAPDGIIEAVEVLDHPFAIGVQWEAGQTEDERLHQALVDAARRAGARSASTEVSRASSVDANS